MRTGSPIVYTSADSVFQVAAHEEVIPLWELYRICETAREILRGPHEVGRVIARPFIGAPGDFTRTANRHDYAVPPPQGMLLDQLARARTCRSTASARSSTSSWAAALANSDKTKNNADGMAQDPGSHGSRSQRGLIFVNLVDFDQQYGHRNDVEGYGARARRIRRWLPQFESRAGRRRPGDLHGRPRLRPHHALHRSQPRIRAAAGRSAPEVRAGVDLGAARARSPTSARPWPRISALRIAQGNSFLSQIL